MCVYSSFLSLFLFVCVHSCLRACIGVCACLHIFACVRWCVYSQAVAVRVGVCVCVLLLHSLNWKTWSRQWLQKRNQVELDSLFCCACVVCAGQQWLVFLGTLLLCCFSLEDYYKGVLSRIYLNSWPPMHVFLCDMVDDILLGHVSSRQSVNKTFSTSWCSILVRILGKPPRIEQMKEQLPKNSSKYFVISQMEISATDLSPNIQWWELLKNCDASVHFPSSSDQKFFVIDLFSVSGAYLTIKFKTTSLSCTA